MCGIILGWDPRDATASRLEPFHPGAEAVIRRCPTDDWDHALWQSSKTSAMHRPRMSLTPTVGSPALGHAEIRKSDFVAYRDRCASHDSIEPVEHGAAGFDALTKAARGRINGL